MSDLASDLSVTAPMETIEPADIDEAAGPRLRAIADELRRLALGLNQVIVLREAFLELFHRDWSANSS